MKAAVLLALTLGMTALSAPPPSTGSWSQLAALPDAEGFAGAFGGVSGDALLVAGGANIVGDRWGQTLNKVWYDDVYLLDRPDGGWRKVGKLARPNGYGVSVTVPNGVLCIGGGDARENFRDVTLLTWSGGQLSSKALPPLPRPCAMMCGSLVGQTVYLAGGIDTPSATSALKTFWALDLNAVDAGWRELEPCPGPARILGVAGAMEGAFYLFSGASLSAGADGKPVRQYLRDAWRYVPGRGWEQLADLPRPAVAAASPAPSEGGWLHVCSGDDGANVTFEPVQKHPGFPHDTLCYDPQGNTWKIQPGLPFSRATVPVVVWRGSYVLPNGEVRPRVRTPEVWRWGLPDPAR